MYNVMYYITNYKFFSCNLQISNQLLYTIYRLQQLLHKISQTYNLICDLLRISEKNCGVLLLNEAFQTNLFNLKNSMIVGTTALM